MAQHRVIAPRRLPAHRAALALLALLALLAAGCGGDDGAGPAVASDTGAVAAVAPTAGGGQLDFGDLEGSPAMLWFWAPW